MNQESEQDLSSKLHTYIDTEEASLTPYAGILPLYTKRQVLMYFRWILEELEKDST